MLNDLKLYNALTKMLDMIFNKEINKILKAKANSFIGKLTKVYFLDTNIVNKEHCEDFNLDALDFETQIIVNKMVNLIKQSSNKISFNSLINEFDNVDLIKLWVCFSIILIKNRESILILKNQEECNINKETILKIIEDKEGFYILYDPLKSDEHYYINELEKIFNSKYSNSPYVDYQKVIDSIQKWFLSLPKYSWVTNKKYIGNGKYQEINKELLKFRDTIKVFPIGPFRTIRYKLPQIFNTKDFGELINKISSAKNYFDSLILSLQNTILNDFDFIFEGNFNDWINRLTIEQKNYLYDNLEEEIFDLKDINRSELTNKLCNVCVGIMPEYFNDDTPKILFERLNDIKNITTKSVDPLNLIRFSGPNFNFTFEKANFNPIVKLLCQEISSILNEYGKSLSQNEKRTALTYAIINKNWNDTI